MYKTTLLLALILCGQISCSLHSTKAEMAQTDSLDAEPFKVGEPEL